MTFSHQILKLIKSGHDYASARPSGVDAGALGAC
jgi:hypothetical protein